MKNSIVKILVVGLILGAIFSFTIQAASAADCGVTRERIDHGPANAKVQVWRVCANGVCGNEDDRDQQSYPV